MRLNFQQQRSINPSAGPNLFVPEGGQGIQNEQNLRIQLIRQQQESLNDVAQASVVVAKAFRDAEIQDENNDLETEANELEKKVDQAIFEFSQTTKGISTVKGELQNLEVLLNSTNETESSKRSDRYQKKRKLIIQGLVGKARKNIMQKASANTKNNSIKALLDIEDREMLSQDPLDLKIARFDREAEQYRPTLGIEVDKKKKEVKKRLIRQRVNKQLVSENAQVRIQALEFLEEQAKNPTYGIPSLYFLEFQRQIKGEAYVIERDSVIATLDQTVQNNDQTELVNWLSKYGSIDTKINEKTGKQITDVVLNKEQWKLFKDTFPHISQKEFYAYLQKGAAQYDKLNNQFSGTIEYSDLRTDFESKNNVYFKYQTELYKIDDDGNLVINQSFEPVGKPWEEALFQKVKSNTEYKEEKHNALVFDAIIENVNMAVSMEPTKENLDIIRNTFEVAKNQKAKIQGESRYFSYANWFLGQKEKEIIRKMQRIRDGQKDFDAIVRKESPIDAPGIETYRKVRNQKSPYKQ